MTGIIGGSGEAILNLSSIRTPAMLKRYTAQCGDAGTQDPSAAAWPPPPGPKLRAEAKMPMSERLPAGWMAKRNPLTPLLGRILSPRNIKGIASTTALVAFGLGAAPAAAQGTAGVYVPRIYLPGFYVRGMAGAAFGTDTTFKDVNSSDPNAVLGPGVELRGDSRTSPLFGGGIGYRFSPMFWADVTAAGITDLKFNNGSTTAGAFTPLQGMSAKIDAIPVMVNGYIDVARALGVALPYQPYLMAGIGFSRNHLGTMTGTVPGFGPVSFTGTTREDFAWGAGAGIGFPLAANLVIDIGYEYLDLGEVRSGSSGTLTIGGIATTAAAGPMKAHLHAHTIQASFRLGF